MGRHKQPRVERREFGFEPRPYQRIAHEQRKRFSVFVWHRRAGKTVFAVMELILAALECKLERPRFAYVCPFLKQAKLAAWDYLRSYSQVVPGVKINESDLSVDFPKNGARIRIFGADNPDSLRSIYYDGVVLDEVAQFKPDVWSAVIRPSLADRKGWAIFIGTPCGVANDFYKFFRQADSDAEWHSNKLTVSQTNIIAPEELESARSTMSAQLYAQEFLCDFGAAVTNSMVALDDAAAAQERTVAEREYSWAPRIIGVDVARYGDDRSVIWPRQGLAAFQPQVMRQLDTVAVAAAVARAITQWKPAAVFVDQGGVGGGVVDYLRHLGHSVIGVDFGGRPGKPQYANKRAEMWGRMAAWLKGGGCLPSAKQLPTLLEELTGPTYSHDNAAGKLQLESKDDMKRRGIPSPDLADALALTFAEEVAPPALEQLSYYRASSVASNDYDPFAGQARGDYDPFASREV